MFPRVQKLSLMAFNLLAVFILLSGGVFAQTGGEDLDPTFNHGTGANDYVAATVLQPDGKILVGGAFTTYNGAARKCLVRLNQDGSLDTTFNQGTGPNGGVDTSVREIALQSDGKILVAGNFTTYDGAPRYQLARLNADGSLDASFNPTPGVNGTVNDIVVEPGDKIILVGSFNTYAGVSRLGIARLNADGSLDTTFNPGTGTGPENSPTAVSLQADGKIIISGMFVSYNGTPRSGIARLNSDGSLDTSFNPGTGPDRQILETAIQPDGKILIGGNFSSYNGASIERIARLNPDGSLDSGFNPGTGANNNVVAIEVRPNGKIVIGGYFRAINDINRPNLAQLRPDGSLDTSFNPNTGFNREINAIALQPDGKVVAGGWFTSFDGISINRVARLTLPDSGALSFSAPIYSVREGQGAATITLRRTDGADKKVTAKVSLADITTTSADYLFAPGAVDASFNPGTGTDNVVSAIAVQPDGKILIGGSFTTYKGTSRNRIARLNADSTLDTSFNPGTGANTAIYAVAVQADGKIIIAGNFTDYNGAASNRIARLNSDGSLDTSFTAAPMAVSNVFTIIIQPDGKIIFGGDFVHNGSTSSRVVRFNSNGSLDSTFTLGTGANSFVLTTALQADGKIIVGGDFTTYNGTSRNRVARLNPDGSLDASFTTGTGANDTVYTATVRPDGKILIGGSFTTYRGNARNRIALLNSIGNPDITFNPGTGANNYVFRTALQADGKAVIVGNFTTYNGAAINRVARINPNGSLDTTFNPGQGLNSGANAVTLQDDGKVLIGGEFNTYHNSNRSHLVRVEGDIFVTWPNGDASNKTISLPIIDDSILEPEETLSLTLIPLNGNVDALNPFSATLSIIDNETSVSAVTGSGVYGQTATLTATLATFSSGLNGKSINFTINGVAVGTAATDSNGTATLTGVSLSGINAGSYPTAVGATFAGDANHAASSSTGALTVSKATPVITWSNPANITPGTPLSSTQLNATANVPGTFQYAPPAGTILTAGTHQLSTTFTPADAVNYNSLTQSVQLTVAVPMLQLMLDESASDPQQVAALDAILFLKDPFLVVNAINLLRQPNDPNTRVMVFVANLQLAEGEPSSSVIVNLVDSNNQSYEVAAEDVRVVPGFDFSQVTFRLPDSLSPGTCLIKVKAHEQESNSGKIRIAN